MQFSNALSGTIFILSNETCSKNTLPLNAPIPQSLICSIPLIILKLLFANAKSPQEITFSGIVIDSPRHP
jgi:hypothetical protein